MPRSADTPTSGDAPWSGDAAVDLVFPPVPSPAPRVFSVAGEETLRRLVRAHHVRLRTSSIGHLFPTDPGHFAAVVERIGHFVVAATGGPSRPSQSLGLTWLRSLHFPKTIDETTRNVWLGAMLMAFDDVGFPAEVREDYWNWVEALSILMINRRTMITQPRRYPLSDAPTALRAFLGSRGD